MNEPATANLPVKSISRSLTRRVLLLGVIGIVGLASTVVLSFWIRCIRSRRAWTGLTSKLSAHLTGFSWKSE